MPLQDLQESLIFPSPNRTVMSSSSSRNSPSQFALSNAYADFSYRPLLQQLPPPILALQTLTLQTLTIQPRIRGRFLSVMLFDEYVGDELAFRSNNLQPSNETSTMIKRDYGLFIDMQMLSEPCVYSHEARLVFMLHGAGVKMIWFSDIPESDLIASSDREARARHHARLYRQESELRLAAFKDKVMKNFKPAPSRWDCLHHPQLKRIGEIKLLLKELSVAKNYSDLSKALVVLNSLNSISRNFARNIYNDQLEDEFSFFLCDCCDEWFDMDERNLTVDDGEICDDCCENYVYSECMSRYILDDDCHLVYNSYSNWERDVCDDYCTGSYGEHHFYRHDNAYFLDEDDRDAARRRDTPYEFDEDIEDNEDIENNDHSDGLPGWHQARRDFVECNETKKYATLGVELEIYCSNRSELVDDLRGAFGKQIILERDGSLDDYSGFEIISQPYGREEWNAFAPDLLTAIQNQGGIGYNGPAGPGYGIHVTVHRRFLSPLAEARIAMFLVDKDNADFVKAIAQRDQIYSSNYGVGMGVVEKPKLYSVSTGNQRLYLRDADGNHRLDAAGAYVMQKGKLAGRGKYCPINFKEDLAEFRIFQSTTNPKSFMKNLEFIWAMIAWTKPEASTGCSHNYKDFLQWLNTPQQRNEFPVLTEFLSKKVFYGVNYPPIVSNWQALMCKPVETEAVEPMAA